MSQLYLIVKDYAIILIYKFYKLGWYGNILIYSYFFNNLFKKIINMENYSWEIRFLQKKK